MTSLLTALIATGCFVAPAQVLAKTIYVDAACGNDAWTGAAADCVAPGGPLQTINAALAIAVTGDTVSVAPGLYLERIDFAGRDLTITSQDPSDPAVVAATIIDGEGLGPVVTFDGSESAAALLTGLTLRNGHRGVLGRGTMATISHCVVSDNFTDGKGAGLHDVDGRIEACRIMNNTADSAGGGFYECDGVISDCLVIGNSADEGAGFFRCNGTIQRCHVLRNEAAARGAGFSRCNGTIDQCVIAENRSGGGAGLNECQGTVLNSLIVRNVGVGIDRPGGVINHCTVADNARSIDNAGNVTISNSIIAGVQTVTNSNNVTLSHVCLPGYPYANGFQVDEDVSVLTPIIGADPQFRGPGDYRLSPTSPCVDTGGSSDATVDLDGAARTVGAAPDIGAYELSGAAVHLSLPATLVSVRGNRGELVSEPFLTDLVPLDGAVDWQLRSDVSWLQFSPASGAGQVEPIQLAIQAELSALPADINYALVTFENLTSGRLRRIPVRVAAGEKFTVATDGSGDFTDLQAAIDAAPPASRIILQPGTYLGAFTLAEPWLELTGSDPDDPAVVAATVLDGQGQSPVLGVTSELETEATLRGVTVTGADGSTAQGVRAAAIRPAENVGNCWLNIDRCVIRDNAVAPLVGVRGVMSMTEIARNGGAADTFALEYAGRIQDTVIRDNLTPGGIIIGNPIINNSVIAGNHTDGLLMQGSGALQDCLVLDNHSTSDFSAYQGFTGRIERTVFAFNSSKDESTFCLSFSGFITDSIFLANRAINAPLLEGRGDISNTIFADNSTLRPQPMMDWCGDVVHTTYVRNATYWLLQAREEPLRYPCTLTMSNAILWDNTVAESIFTGPVGSRIIVAGSVVQGGTGSFVGDGEFVWNEDNLSSDPQFVDAGLHLQPPSPAIDQGRDLGVAADIEGLTRPQGTGSDPGAYEHVPAGTVLTAAPLAVELDHLLGETAPSAVIDVGFVAGETDAWEATTDAPWLTLTPASGSGVGQIVARLDLATQPPVGTQVGWIEINATVATNAPLRIPVVLSVRPVLQVCADGSGDFTTITEAITVAREHDVIEVCPGTYEEDLDFQSKNLTLRSTDPADPTIVGATVLKDFHETVIDIGHVFLDGGNTAATVIDGFTITGGTAGTFVKPSGALSPNPEAVVRRCVITGNGQLNLFGGYSLFEEFDGLIDTCLITENERGPDGAVFVDCDVTIRDSEIANNETANDGGVGFESTLRIESSQIAGNHAARWGGAFKDCTVTLVDSEVSRNTTNDDGGAFYNCSVDIDRCRIAHNRSIQFGGGFAGGDGVVANSVIEGHYARYGGAIFNSTLTIYNSTFVGNRFDAINVRDTDIVVDGCLFADNYLTNFDFYNNLGSLTVTNSYVLDAPPLFVAPGDWSGSPRRRSTEWLSGDYRLLAASPAIDAGPLAPPDAVGLLDWSGEPRIVNCRIDQGAFEYQVTADCNDNGTADGCDVLVGGQVDCNANLVPDDCDPVSFGDFDADSATTFDDVAVFLDVMAGPDVALADADCAALQRLAFDAAADGDIDLIDLASLQLAGQEQ